MSSRRHFRLSTLIFPAQVVVELIGEVILHKFPAGFLGLNCCASVFPHRLMWGFRPASPKHTLRFIHQGWCSVTMAQIRPPAMPPPPYNLSMGAEVDLGEGRAMEVLLGTICSDVWPEPCERYDVLGSANGSGNWPHPPHYIADCSPCVFCTINNTLLSYYDDNTTVLHIYILD